MENPIDTQRIGFWVRFWRGFILGLLTLIGIFCIFTVYQSVSAHGYAEWFNKDMYVDRDGGHCCGIDDCKYLEEYGATVTEMEHGYLVITKDHGSHFFPRQTKKNAEGDEIKGGNDGGLYFTQDVDNKYVLCIYFTKIKCLAVPRKPKS